MMGLYQGSFTSGPSAPYNGAQSANDMNWERDGQAAVGQRQTLRHDKDRKPMTDVTAKDYIDARSDAVRAQNDARFSEVLTEIRSLSVKIDHVPTTRSMIVTTLSGIAGATALFLGILAFAGDRFDGGVSLAEQQQQQIERDKAQDERLNSILDRLEALTAPPPR